MNVDPANSELQVDPEEDFTQFLVDGFIDANALLKKKRELKQAHAASAGVGPAIEEC